MEFKYFGYFLAVCVIILVAVTLWILRMFFKERVLMHRGMGKFGRQTAKEE